MTYVLDIFTLVNIVLEFIHVPEGLALLSIAVGLKPSRVARSQNAPNVRNKQKDYWKQRAEVDTGEETTNTHHLSARILKRGGPITHMDVNAVQNAPGITEGELSNLLSIPYTEYPLTAVGVVSNAFRMLYPANVAAGLGRWGVYMYINNITGVYYVGSSVVLHERLRHYWKKWADGTPLRSILADIKEYGLENFTLRVYELPESLRELRLLLALEQFYILSMNPGNNDIMVAAGSPGGKHLAAKLKALYGWKVYVYLGDKLLHIFPSQRDFISGLVTAFTTAKTALDTGLLFGVFTVTLTPLGEVSEDHLISLSELKVLVDKARKDSLKTRVTKGTNTRSPRVTLTNVSTGEARTFDHFQQASQWSKTQTGKHLTHQTIERRIQSGVPLNGFLITLA